jgi:hypothetical protein
MNRLIFLCLLVLAGAGASGQELFVATEPASNMPRHSIGGRFTFEGMKRGGYRLAPEFMIGASRDLMIHGSLYRSNLYPDHNWSPSVYAKYRFFSVDSVQKHFRSAVYARYSHTENTLLYDEVNLEGDNSGFTGGIVVTQLMSKLAVSASAGYIEAFSSRSGIIPKDSGKQASYSLSAGYLLFPKEYTGYGQVNINLYAELLGKSAFDAGKSYLEIAPAVQFIFASRLRVDLSKRAQLYGNMSRSTKNMYLVRMEYSIFNVF